MAIPGPTTQGCTERWAANLLRDARVRRGWSQRRLAAAAGVQASTVARIESSTRQPSSITLSRLLAADELELRIRVDEYDDHDEVLDARRATTSPEQRRAADAASDRTTAVLAASRAGARVGPRDRPGWALGGEGVATDVHAPAGWEPAPA